MLQYIGKKILISFPGRLYHSENNTIFKGLDEYSDDVTSEIMINQNLNLDLIEGDIIPNKNEDRQRNINRDLTQRWPE